MALTSLPGSVEASLQVDHQTSLFGSAPFRCGPVSARFEPLDAESNILFQPGWVQGSDQVFEQLRDELPWRAMERPMYDRIVAVPRLICTVEISTLDRTHPLTVIAEAFSHLVGAQITQLGANYYRTGNDSVAWHRDRVGKKFRHSSTVALVSVGSPRTLQIRPFRDTNGVQSKQHQPPGKHTLATPETLVTRRSWALGHGDLFVMSGACQRDWEHCVPKQTHVGPRISLAFRSEEAGEGPQLGSRGVPPLLASHKLE